MSDDTALVMQEGREMRRRGQYADAARHLEKLVNGQQPTLPLIVELGETFFLQGEYARCSTLLKSHLPDWASDLEPLALAGHLIHSFAHFFMTTQFRENLKRADAAYASYLSSAYSKVTDEASVLIEIYYAGFWHLSAMCGSFDDSPIQKQLLPRLETKFFDLLGRGAFRDAFSVARVCNTCDHGPNRHDLLRRLLEDVRTPGVYIARAQLLLAQGLSEDQREEQCRLYLAAQELFKDEGHVHGGLDAELAILCLQPFSMVDDHFEEKVIAILKQYETLEYPFGLASCLLLLADTAHKLGHINAEAAFLNDLEALHTASGARLSWLMIRISVLARLALRGGDHGKVVHGGEALWQELVNSDCSALRGQIALFLSTAYFGTKNHEKSTFWAERAKSNLAGSKLIELPNFVESYDLSGFEGIMECYQSLSCSIDPGRMDYSAEAAAQRFEELIQGIIRHPRQEERSWEVIGEIIDTWEQHISRCTEKECYTTRLAKAREARSTILTFRSSSRHDIEFESAALDHLKEARQLYLKAKEMGRSLLVLHHEALLNVYIAQKFERINDYEQAILAWQTGRSHYEVVVNSAGSLGLSSIETENAYWVAFCEFRLWLHGKYTPDEVLHSLLKAERFTDKQRQEVSILRGVSAVTAKRGISSAKHVRNIYQLAIQICNAQKNKQEAWDWVQKSKARSLSDALGLGILVPQQLMDRINRNPKAIQLLERETTIAESLKNIPEIEHFKVRKNLESLQAEMRAEQALAELLDLREGVPLSLSAFSSPEVGRDAASVRGLVFVDWIAFDNDISMFVAKEAEQPMFFKLPITGQYVREWVSEHLNNDPKSDVDSVDARALSGLWEEDDDEGPLRALDALVAPIFALTQPDDLVVLCPTGILHALPLHALQFGPPEERQILIERNLVVYCASLTAFVQCCRRSEARPVAGLTKRFLAVYEQASGRADEPLAPASDTERERLYAFTKQQADELNGDSLVGEQVTPASIRASLEGADWVQFFGHHDYSYEAVAEQALLVYGDGQASSGSPPHTVAVKDFFDFRIKALHMTLLACASAVQDFQAGDEPLGLIAALLTAGVTSVVGTLWPVQLATAQFFSERFHYHLSDVPARFQSSQGWHNLAYAMREAVLDVRNRWEDFRQPYHWASLVLHGAWFYNGDLK